MKQRKIRRTEVDRHRPSIQDLLYTLRVVRMAVCETDGNQAQAPSIENFEHSPRIVGRIDEHGFTRIMDDVPFHGVAADLAVHGFDPGHQGQRSWEPFVHHDVFQAAQTESERAGDRAEFSPIMQLITTFEGGDVRTRQPRQPRDLSH